MNAKLFAIALIAAVAYASISVSRAYGTELAESEQDVIHQCMELKLNISDALIAMEEYEKSGGIVPPEVTAEILYGARIYTDVCADRTGPLLEEIE